MNNISIEISDLIECRDRLTSKVDVSAPKQTLLINDYPPIYFSNTADDISEDLPAGGCGKDIFECYKAGIQPYEPLMTSVLIMLGRVLPEIRMVDVGALWGHTSFIAGAVCQKLTSHMFEMNPHTCEVLSRNIRLNQDANKNYFSNNVLLANQNGNLEVTFKHYTARYGENQGGSNLSKLKVLRQNFKTKIKSLLLGKQSATYQKITMRVAALDDYLKEINFQPNIIKIDVEGSQFDILQGAKEYIKSNRPILLVEFDTPDAANYIGKPNRDIVRMLEGFNYSCLWGDHRKKSVSVHKINSDTDLDIEKNSLGIFLPN